MNNSFDFLDAVQAPIVMHDSSWSDTISKRIKDLVLPERLTALYAKEEMGTLPEVACYLSTRSAVAPMDSDWCEIFCHVTCSILQKYYKEDHWQALGARKELSNDQKRQLTELRYWIYNKRRQRLRERMKKG